MIGPVKEDPALLRDRCIQTAGAGGKGDIVLHSDVQPWRHLRGLDETILVYCDRPVNRLGNDQDFHEGKRIYRPSEYNSPCSMEHRLSAMRVNILNVLFRPLKGRIES